MNKDLSILKHIVINTDTLDKMRRMRLLGMHRAFKTSIEASTTDGLTADELIATLVDSEWDDRQNRTIERSLRRVHPSATRLQSNNWSTARKEV